MRGGRVAARLTGGTAILRALLRQRRRLLLAGVSIALGVGYLAGALGLLDRIGAGLDQLASATADRADVVVEGEVAYESSLEQVRRLVPADVASTIAEVDGVASVSHRLEDVALVLDPDGQPVAAPGLSEQPLGVNWPEDSAVSNLELLEGTAPSSDDQVVIDAHSAEVARVEVGEEVRVAGKGKVGDYLVSGIVDADAAGRSAGSSLVALTTPEARLVFDQPTDDNRLAVVVSPGADVDSVIAALQAVVPPGVEVTDGPTAAAHAQESLTRSFALVRVLVTSFGVLALLVGMVTVANSLALLHAQRRRLFAAFRLVGARRAQLRRAALGEATLLALVSALVGIPLGLLLAVLIERALGALGTAVPTAGPLLRPTAVLVAVAVGVLATVAAAWRPVRTACSVPPIEAVQEVAPPERSRHPLVVTALSRALVVGVAVGAVGLIASASAPITVGVAVGAAIAVFLASFVPLTLTAIVASVMRLLPFRPKPLRLVAARDVRRNPRRTAATTAAVLLAAAVVSGLAVFLQSFTASVNEAVGDLVTADLVVDSETFTRGGLPADLVEQLGFVDGVEAVSPWQLGRGSVGEYAVRMTGLDGRTAGDVLDPSFVGDPPDGVAPDAVWISESLADRTGLGVGDPLPLVFYSGGYEDLSISGIYSSGQALLGDVVLDRAVLTRQVPATPDLVALVRTDGAESTAVAVSELSASYGVPAVSTPEDFVGQRGEMLRGFERVVLWMLLFTLLQALVGVVNTLMMSVGERRREFGLLRVAGTSRRALLQMVLFEGVSFSSVGTLLGVLVGTAAAALGVLALAPFGLGVFTVPVATLALIAAAALVVGVAAAWIPARMAASVPPLEAVLDVGAAPVTARTLRPVPRREVPQVAVRAGSPARPTVPAGATSVPAPPPFDPSRLPWPLPPAFSAATNGALAPEGVLSAQDVLSVAVLDGSSVVTLGAGSPEAEALLELYGMHQPTSASPSRPSTAPVEQPGLSGMATPTVPPTVETAIGVLLGDALFGPSETASPFAAEAPPPEPPATHDLGAQVPSTPFSAGPPTPPPVAPRASGVPGDNETDQDHHAGIEQHRFGQGAVPGERQNRRAGLRRSRRRDPADRRPPRRTRRGSVPGPAEGWVATSTAGPEAVSPAQQPPPGAARRTPEAAAGLSPAAERLDSLTRERWSAVLHSMNAALANGEHVGPLVCGRVQAAPAAVARTDRRLLVVAQRPGRMAVESLHPLATGVVVRPGPGGTVVVILFDRGRQLEVTDVRDVREAESLVLRDALVSDVGGSQAG